MNNFRTWLLMGLLTVLLVFAGQLIGGNRGMLFMLVFSVIMNFSGYWWSDKIALAMTHSRPVSETQAPELYEIVGDLSQRAELPMPRIYITPSAQPNAFATGRNPEHAVVAVTEGLMQILSKEEIEGVLGHELAHVKHRDILIGSMAAMMAGAISALASIARWGLIFGRDDEDGAFGLIGTIATIIVMPIAAMLVQLAISRSREYGADEAGAKIAGRPDGLVSALLKLERGAKAIPMNVSPAASHMFIVNPLSSGAGLANLFSTHPPIAERVARLKRSQ